MTIDLPTSLGGADPHAGALTHVDKQGQAHMVDITGKAVTRRLALARCLVITAADANRVLAPRPGGIDVVEVARVSGIQAAKQTSSLIPLCHPVRLDRIAVEVDVARHCVTVQRADGNRRAHRRRDGGPHGVRHVRPFSPQSACGGGPGGLDGAADPLAQVRRSFRRVEPYEPRRAGPSALGRRGRTCRRHRAVTLTHSFGGSAILPQHTRGAFAR